VGRLFPTNERARLEIGEDARERLGLEPLALSEVSRRHFLPAKGEPAKNGELRVAHAVVGALPAHAPRNAGDAAAEGIGRFQVG
jgi:hypothetical protein